ncbi:tetratricopeptide repeat protein, partial [Nonomuraea sp. NPDC055795]
AQIEAGLAGLARALVAGVDSVAAGQASLEEAAAWAMAWLAGRTGWLVVFDNVEEPAHVEPYLARLNGGQVLITTRRDVGWRHLGITPLRLDTLARPASVRLLGDLIGPPDAAQLALLDELAAELGDLPLALTQAGAYIARTPRCTVAGYLRLLRRTPARMHATAPAGGDAERVVAKAWELSRARVTELDPLAGRLLNLLACYAPDHLPCVVLAGAGDDEQAVNEALALLASYSLITLTTHHDDPNDETVSTHRLVQCVIWHQLDDDHRNRVRGQAAALISAALPGRPAVLHTRALYRRLLPHAQAVLAPASPEWEEFLDYLDAGGDYATAANIQRRIHAHVLDTYGPEHEETLAARSYLADWTALAGNVVAARDMYAEVLHATARLLGPDHPDTLTTRANFAYWTGEAGDVVAAREMFAELLPHRVRVLGPDHPNTLTTRNNLARWTGEAGDMAAAHAMLTELLPDRVRVLGPDHPNTLTTRHNLAHSIGMVADAAAARDMFVALLPDRVRVLGADHPNTLTTRRFLAHWTGRAGDAVAARDVYTALLPAHDRVFGPDHPHTLTARNNLAYWIERAGDPETARDHHLALLPQRVRVLGPDHPDTLATRGSLAYCTGKVGDVVAALEMFAELLADRERALGPDHPDTLTTRNKLARWTGEAGVAAAAREMLAELLADRERALGPDHPDTVTTRDNLAEWGH